MRRSLQNADMMNLLNGGLLKWSFCKYAFLISLFLAFGPLVNAATLSSPDGRLVLAIETTIEGNDPPTPHLVYQLAFRGKLLIEPSVLRLDLESQPPLGSNIQIVNTTASNEDHTYFERCRTGIRHYPQRGASRNGVEGDDDRKVDDRGSARGCQPAGRRDDHD